MPLTHYFSLGAIIALAIYERFGCGGLR